MNFASLETLARLSVEHIFNAIPAGFVIAFFAWLSLRVLRQNSGTRFVIWFLALVGIFAFPVVSGLGKSAGFEQSTLRPSLTLPESWALLIFAVWAIGALAGMVRLAAGIWRMQVLRRQCTVIDPNRLHPSVRRTVEAFSSQSRLKIRIAISDEARVPSAIGLGKRTIILPEWTLQEIPPADLSAILLHEFAHLRRGDDWTNLIQKIVRALFFFHPAVWWLDDRLSTEREMACDDAVLAETDNPRGYANCLVSLLEKSFAHRGWSMAQAAVNRAREASLRLAQILDKNRIAQTRVWAPAVGVVGVFSVICLAVSSPAPQFIAFGQQSTHSTLSRVRPSLVHLSTVRSSTPSHLVPSAMLSMEKLAVPAKLNFSAAKFSTNKNERRPAMKAALKKVIARPLEPAIVANQSMSGIETAAQLVAVRENNNHKVASQFHTLMFVETAQNGDPESGQVIVKVWSVMWISAAQAGSNIPVANSI